MINKTFVAIFGLLLTGLHLQTRPSFAEQDYQKSLLGINVHFKYSSFNQVLFDFVNKTMKKSDQNRFKTVIETTQEENPGELFEINEFDEEANIDSATKNSFSRFFCSGTYKNRKRIALYPITTNPLKVFYQFFGFVFFLPGSSPYPDFNDKNSIVIEENEDPNEVIYDYYSKTETRIWNAMRLCFTSAAVLYSGQKLINLFFNR